MSSTNFYILIKLIDMSGGVCETLYVKDFTPDRTDILWSIFFQAYENGSIIGCCKEVIFNDENQ